MRTDFKTDPTNFEWLAEATGLDLARAETAFARLRTRGVVQLMPADDTGDGQEISVTLAGTGREWGEDERRILDHLLRVHRDPRHPHVTRTPGICGGASVIAGTRIPVEMIAGYFQAGKGVWEIQRDYPYLGAEEILDALHYDLDRRRNAGEPLAA